MAGRAPGCAKMTADIGKDQGPDLDRLREFVAEQDRNAAWFFVGHVMAEVRNGGSHRHRIVDTIRARSSERPEGSSARHLPAGMSPENFLEHLIHRGALQEGEDDRLACPIPSFRTFLVAEAVRTMFDRAGNFVLEGAGEHLRTEHDARLLLELTLAREPGADDPWAGDRVE